MISEETIKKILDFRDAREWKKFHNGKDLAISISLEANELLELFQWSGTDLDVPENQTKMEEELADIIMYAFLFADAYKIDVEKVLLSKLIKNEEKYPAELARGRKDKYTELKHGKK